jgi:hypothetical protein
MKRVPSASPDRYSSTGKSKEWLYSSVLQKERPTSVICSHRFADQMLKTKSSARPQTKETYRKRSETSHANAIKHMSGGGFDLVGIQEGRLSQIYRATQSS